VTTKCPWWNHGLEKGRQLSLWFVNLLVEEDTMTLVSGQNILQNDDRKKPVWAKAVGNGYQKSKTIFPLLLTPSVVGLGGFSHTALGSLHYSKEMPEVQKLYKEERFKVGASGSCL
jgi:hypothetical protein